MTMPVNVKVRDRAAAAADANTIRFATGDGKFGRVLVARSAAGVCAVLFGDDDAALRADLAARFTSGPVVADAAGLAATLHAVIRHMENPGAAFALPLDLRGTPFQRRVWQALQAIPAGQTAGYGDIATRIGAPGAARAVASACAANPLAVLVPCHRVVRRDGGLSGYRWGPARKRALLAREAVLHEAGPNEAVSKAPAR